MFLLIALFASSPALAESVHLPPEMRQKVDEASSAVAEGMRTAHRKIDRASHESDLLHSLSVDLGKLWTGVKHKSHSLALYLDHQLHEHVLGPDSSSTP